MTCLKEPEWNWQDVTNTQCFLWKHVCFTLDGSTTDVFFPMKCKQNCFMSSFKKKSLLLDLLNIRQCITFSSDALSCLMLGSARLTKKKTIKSRSYCQWIILDYASILFECFFFRIKTFHPFPGSHFSTNGLHVTSCRNLGFVLLV